MKTGPERETARAPWFAVPLMLIAILFAYLSVEAVDQVERDAAATISLPR